ncbi:hypothetical protein B0H34DRAFT_708066 [Crassisporium funariophilum]|nr:hypothetical protein B0H34DRAFT_708066 [Crassisporium funariophilum]
MGEMASEAGPSTSQNGRSKKRSRTVGNLSTKAAAPKSSIFQFGNSATQSTSAPSGFRKAKARPLLQPSSNEPNPTKTSSRVSRPSAKIKYSHPRVSPDTNSDNSDGTPPLSIRPTIPASSKKRKKFAKPRHGTIELFSDSDTIHSFKPPVKRRKLIQKRLLTNEIIDLCSDEDQAPPAQMLRQPSVETEVVVILTTDDEEQHVVTYQAKRVQCSSSRSPEPDQEPSRSPSLAFISPVSNPRTNLTPESEVNEEIQYTPGYLQAIYNKALNRSTYELDDSLDDNYTSPFFGIRSSQKPRIITYADDLPTPALHTPLFFSRIVLRPAPFCGETHSPPFPVQVAADHTPNLLHTANASIDNEMPEKLSNSVKEMLKAVIAKPAHLADSLALVKDSPPLSSPPPQAQTIQRPICSTPLQVTDLSFSDELNISITTGSFKYADDDDDDDNLSLSGLEFTYPDEIF